MRFDKARQSKSLSQIVSVMGSIDISGQGRSTGFEELESGVISKNKRVPTLAARRDNPKKMATRAVRLDRVGQAFKFSQFRGKGIRSKKARVARMLMAIRKGAIGNKPFIIPNGMAGQLSKMPAGIWRKGRGRFLNLVNPFKENVGKRTKKIAWMRKAVAEVTTDANLKKAWGKEIDSFLRFKA